MNNRPIALLALAFLAAESALAQSGVIGAVSCGITKDAAHRGYQLRIDCNSDSDCRRALARHRCNAHDICEDGDAPVVFPAKTLTFLIIIGATSGAILGDSRVDENGNELPSLAGPGAIAGGGGGAVLAGIINSRKTSFPVTVITTTLGGAALGAGLAGIRKEDTGKDETAKLAGGGAVGGLLIGALFGAVSGGSGGNSKFQRIPVGWRVSTRSVGLSLRL